MIVDVLSTSANHIPLSSFVEWGRGWGGANRRRFKAIVVKRWKRKNGRKHHGGHVRQACRYWIRKKEDWVAGCSRNCVHIDVISIWDFRFLASANGCQSVWFSRWEIFDRVSPSRRVLFIKITSDVWGGWRFFTDSPLYNSVENTVSYLLLQPSNLSQHPCRIEKLWMSSELKSICESYALVRRQ